jgi:hypothetical protein
VERVLHTDPQSLHLIQVPEGPRNAHPECFRFPVG